MDRGRGLLPDHGQWPQRFWTFSLGGTFIFILSRDPNLFRKPSEPRTKQLVFEKKNDG